MSDMPDMVAHRKMSVSMRGAIVLNKNKSDELQKKVRHLRKSRDEILMELKSQQLQLALRKIQDEREKALKDEIGESNVSAKRKLSKTTSDATQIGRKHSERFLLPPINKPGYPGSVISESRSAPCSPCLSPITSKKLEKSTRKKKGSTTDDSAAFYEFGSSKECDENGQEDRLLEEIRTRKISRPKLSPPRVRQQGRRATTTLLETRGFMRDPTSNETVDTLECKFRELRNCRYLRSNTELQARDLP